MNHLLFLRGLRTICLRLQSHDKGSSADLQGLAVGSHGSCIALQSSYVGSSLHSAPLSQPPLEVLRRSSVLRGQLPRGRPP
ncbi:hypothetical protein CRENBAI_007541, partial [Crenichthys baileyi]